jgi:hypothetical protein
LERPAPFLWYDEEEDRPGTGADSRNQAKAGM